MGGWGNTLRAFRSNVHVAAPPGHLLHCVPGAVVWWRWGPGGIAGAHENRRLGVMTTRIARAVIDVVARSGRDTFGGRGRPWLAVVLPPPTTSPRTP